MTGNQIRQKFLAFFEERGHRIMPSASLIPHNDPSILWTAAGMVPFKSFFTGQAQPEVRRVVTCQKCLRTPDIEEVGKTARHHTFFEMLGNFSFGDYFKAEAIPWAWEFIVDVLGLDPDQLWITIYLDDDQAFDIWHQQVGVPKDRIVRMGKDTNYWEIGVGPCGPCSEIYIDLGVKRGCNDDNCSVGCECDRFLEIWNLVFIQFFRDEAQNYTPLKNKGVDTGMGLERIAAVLQKVPTNFDTDLMKEIMDFTAVLLNIKYGENPQDDLALKVIADHTRAITFAIGDGALPSNEGRGYVIRRLLRRAVRFVCTVTGTSSATQQAKETTLIIHKIAGEVIKQMGGVYPELKQKQEHILQVILTEEERFIETLAQGTAILNQLIKEILATGTTGVKIAGEDVFRLYDTYGFPLELTREIAVEQGLTVDEVGFAKALAEQRQRARGARQQIKYLSPQQENFQTLRNQFGETEFVGYHQLNVQANLLAILKEGLPELAAENGAEIALVLDITPFYAESGGQVADHGYITGENFKIKITGVHKPVDNFIIHTGKVISGKVTVNTTVMAEVAQLHRTETVRNHSAAHLLHQALKTVLGEHVNQAGSLVGPARLRFDFTHYAALSKQELNDLEELVNDQILANLAVEIWETSLAKAKSMGAAALFGEKYGQKVRVVKMGDFSLELCGGTHVQATSEIGLFKLVSESSISAGVRRIEAVTGKGVLQYLKTKEEQLNQAAAVLKVAPNEVAKRVQALQQSAKELTHQLEILSNKLSQQQTTAILEQVREFNGVKMLTTLVTVPDVDSLRHMADLLRDKLDSGIVVLGAEIGGKASLVAVITKDLLNKGVHAGKVIKEIAKIVGGGGGGRPDMAQAGGKDPAQLQAAIKKAVVVIEAQLLAEK